MAREHDNLTVDDFGENDHHAGHEQYGDEGDAGHIEEYPEEGEGFSEEENSSSEWGEEGDEEYPEEGEGYDEEGEAGEASSEEEQKKPWKKYGIIGAAVVLLGGAATWVMGGHNQQTTPPQVAASHLKPGLHKTPFGTQTAQNNNGFPSAQNASAPVQGPQLAPPGQTQGIQTPNLPTQQASNGLPQPEPLTPPNAGPNGFQNGFPQQPAVPGQGNFRPNIGRVNPMLHGGVYENGQGLSPYQRHQIEDDASNTVLRTITAMGKSLHEDIHKTSDDEKALINKRIDDLQALIMKRLDAIAASAGVHGDSSSAPVASEASHDQIEGIRDTLSALRLTLESSNTAQKGQQDTIAALRSEIESLRSSQQDNTPHSYARPAPVRHKAPARHVDADTSSDAPVAAPAPVKKIDAGWKLRGYNSSVNTVVLQSPKGDYYEESIGYLAKDDGGKDLGIGKIKAIEKLDSGSYVLHTSLGDIQQGH